VVARGGAEIRHFHWRESIRTIHVCSQPTYSRWSSTRSGFTLTINRSTGEWKSSPV